MMNLREVFQAISENRTDQVVIASMTSSVEWPFHSKAGWDIGMMAPMGGAGPLGLGIALAQPRTRVLVLDSDGALLMNFGVLVTMADQAPRNLLYMVVNNGVYGLTGGQPIPGIGKFAFPDVAKAVGFKKVYSFSDIKALKQQLPAVLGGEGLAFVELKAETPYNTRSAEFREKMSSPTMFSRYGRQGVQAVARRFGTLRMAEPPKP